MLPTQARMMVGVDAEAVERDVVEVAEERRERLRAEADPWIGYLVVRHAEPAPWPVLIARAARGLCAMREANLGSEELRAWEDLAIRKVCLRAKEGEWRRLVAGTCDPVRDVVVDDGLVVLAPRRRTTAVEQGLGKLQVCRWTHDDLPEGDLEPPAPAEAPDLAVLDRGEMGVGKQLAQAAHAAHLAHQACPDGRRVAWQAAGWAVAPRSCGADGLAALAGRAGSTVVHDAGLTEVAPGTLTAVLARH